MAEIRPQEGPQAAFLSSDADLVIYGGAAYGGKSFGLLLEALRHIKNPKFGAVIFRKTYPQIMNEGGLWSESMLLYPHAGGDPKESDTRWVFPSGAAVKFAHMQHESSVLNYQGAQIALIGWDELTHFSERQFFYMLSRNRSTCGIRPYVRATTNPDADSWVAKFISWWWDDDTGYAIPERAGVVRWFIRVNDKLVWAGDKAELLADHPQIPPKSVTFIPAKVHDNKIGMAKDPGYLANLLALPLVDRERLLGGNWKIRASAGKVFNRSWFETVDAIPAGGIECRFWDFASTEKKIKGDDPDSTASVRIRKVNGVYYITDCTDDQIGPAQVDTTFKNIIMQDVDELRHTTKYLARWEQEPGSAAKRESRRYTQMLDGIDARSVKPTGDKVTRAGPLAAQAEAGNVKLLRGAWNEHFLKQMHGFPDLDHDDVPDAASGAYYVLSGAGRPRKRSGTY